MSQRCYVMLNVDRNVDVLCRHGWLWQQGREVSTIRATQAWQDLRTGAAAHERMKQKPMGAATVETCQEHNTATCMNERTVLPKVLHVGVVIGGQILCLLSLPPASSNQRSVGQATNYHVLQSSSDAHSWRPTGG